jgi:hypothetical protein
MKPEIRYKLAHMPFEEKIRKVGELIRLSRKVRAQRVRDDASNYPRSGRSLSATAENPQLIELPSKNSKNTR